jgi:ketosteroid isomerase-like protein
MIVRFSDLRVATHPDYGVSVMNQDFIGDSRYKSYGRKTLYWKKDSRGSWKIVHEDFSKMPIRPVKLAKSELTLLSPDSSSSISTKNKNL